MTQLIVHGGAGSIAEERQGRRVPVLNEAADEGYALLKTGHSAAKAVRRTVMILENHALFNAGIGSALTIDGRVEMDAAIMSSAGTLGAVSGLTNVRHPVRVAQLVSERTDHCFLTGAGLTSFVSAHDIPSVDPVTIPRLVRWKQLLSLLRKEGYDVERIPDPDVWGHCVSIVERVRGAGPDNTETVGAVATDQDGVTAAATSTGGKPYKLPGRVGDSPVAGAGTLARDTGGVSVTGDGEGILRMGIAHQALDELSSRNASRAAERLVERAGEEEVSCGLVLIDAENEAWGTAYNTEAMNSVVRR